MWRDRVVVVSHKLIKRDALILMVLLSLCTLALLLMEVVFFFVKKAVYTLLGVIVNAPATLQYITGNYAGATLQYITGE